MNARTKGGFLLSLLSYLYLNYTTKNHHCQLFFSEKCMFLLHYFFLYPDSASYSCCYNLRRLCLALISNRIFPAHDSVLHSRRNTLFFVLLCPIIHTFIGKISVTVRYISINISDISQQMLHTYTMHIVHKPLSPYLFLQSIYRYTASQRFCIPQSSLHPACLHYTYFPC